MLTGSGRPTLGRRVRNNGNFRRLVALALTFLMLTATLLVSAVVPAQAAEGSDAGDQESGASPAGSAGATLQDQKCGVEVAPAPPVPRQVDLVLDDSGSMFTNDGVSVDRWSNAKYSLEVFAAMLGPEDILNVYRTSDFVDGKTSGPAAQVSGDAPVDQRIGAIHQLDMIGGGTPYAPVQAAVGDLAQSTFEEKWLVVVSDGVFEGVEDAQVQADMEKFAAEHTTGDTLMRVAFLAIGDSAPALTNNPDGGVFFQQAKETDELLSVMTGFSNRIFARSQVSGEALSDTEWQVPLDVELEELLVFAQGPDVELGDLASDGTALEPDSVAAVSWVDNPKSEDAAVPNKKLTGKLATYSDVPKGEATLEISGAQVVDFFYKPKVSFGIVLRDADGKAVEADKIVGGDYAVDFGFMDSDCNFVDSPLLGDVTYSAQALQDGEVISESLSPGDTISLGRGNAQFRVSASYLNDNLTEAVVDVAVLRPAQPTVFKVEPKTFQASELNEYAMPEDAMTIRYGMDVDGAFTPFSEDEWASFTPESFAVSSEERIDFDLALGDVGVIYLLPRAPGGQPMDAATGEVPFSLEAEHVYDEQLIVGTLDAAVDVHDDFSFWQRALHWLATQGWKWALLLLALIAAYGYVRRPRLPKKLRKFPLIDFRPKNFAMRSTQSDGKVTKNSLPKFVPFMPDAATIRYVPRGAGGFPALKVKAVRGGRMRVVNWANVARLGTVEFDGELLDKESKKARNLSGTSAITANAADGSYTCQLGSSKKGKGA